MQPHSHQKPPPPKPNLNPTRNQPQLHWNPNPQAEENGTEKVISQSNQQMLSQILANASEPIFHLRNALGPHGSTSDRRTHKCCVYIAGSSKYCARLNSIQAYSDINRDVS